MYENTRLHRAIRRYLRDFRERGFTEKYTGELERILEKFYAHCEQRGIRNLRGLNASTVECFLEKHALFSASYQRQVACFVRMFLKHVKHRTAENVRLRAQGASRTRVDWLTPDEAARIFQVPMTPRQAVLITAGLMQGLRRIETLRITVKDAQEALLGGILRVRGKGFKERGIPLHGQFAEVLRDYLSILEPTEEPRRLLNIKRSSSEDELGAFCKKFGKRFGFHTLRRTFGRSLWLNGVRLETISQLLGHASTDMTRLYIGVNLDDMREALTGYQVRALERPCEGGRFDV